MDSYRHEYLVHVGERFQLKVARVNDSIRPNRNRQVKSQCLMFFRCMTMVVTDLAS